MGKTRDEMVYEFMLAFACGVNSAQYDLIDTKDAKEIAHNAFLLAEAFANKMLGIA